MNRSESLTVDVEAGVRVARAMAGRFAGNGVPADELVGEAFLVLARVIVAYNPEKRIPFVAFVGQCVARQLAHFRAYWLRRQPLAGVGYGDRDGPGQVDRVDVRAVGPADLVAVRDDVEAVRRRLPARSFAIAWDCLGEERTMSDIGARHGLTPKAVSKIVSKAIEQLRTEAVG